MKKAWIRKGVVLSVVLLCAAPLVAQTGTVEKERLEFKALLLQNPNYFGNLPKSPFPPVHPMTGNTKYEELTCLGFSPHLDLIYAVVQVKLPVGYNGSLCTNGSREYVRFFINYGSGWENVGLASVNVHNIPNAVDCAGKATKPLSYSVGCSLTPKRKRCTLPVLPRIRAILSWEDIPSETDPEWPITWGNRLDRQIQIKPRMWILSDVFDHFQLELNQKIVIPPDLEEAQAQPIPVPDPPPLTLAQLVQLYKPSAKAQAAWKVEPHRFGYADIQASLGDSFQSKDVLDKIAAWKAQGLNWQGAINDLLATSGNTTYEQLECVGLDYNQDWLVATVRIKQECGYLGKLCSRGSMEYVAFWADFDNTCQWQYLGTASFRVHDIDFKPGLHPPLPPHLDVGLHYAAVKPVNLDAIRRLCGTPKVARLRAVLSWHKSPSTTDPDLLPYWGNRVDTHIQIKPGAPVPPNTPVIWTIGGFFVDQIYQSGAYEGMTTSDATFALTGLAPDSLGRHCPFGGRVAVTGPAGAGVYYRVRERELPGGAWVNVVTKLENLRDMNFVPFTNAPVNSEGFFKYVDNVEDILARWDTIGDALHEVRLELASLPDDSHIVSSVSYVVQLDNTYPDVDIFIDNGGNCKDFLNTGPLIQGHFVARDAHFGFYDLYSLPYSAPAGKLSPEDGSTQTTVSPGDSWQLNASGMAPCGYVMVVWARDVAVIDSSWVGHRITKSVGFCLRQST